ncbi:diguanylate cyclase [Kibdelosporangium lantanae]|uniref:Diguanylate cyclase n=1 Tax=Kibdelosporangium lantanae TaxID=1497396 RepID=A0ABW3MAR2_9PSEU
MLLLLIVDLAAVAGGVIAFTLGPLVRTNIVMATVLTGLGLVAAELSIRVERLRRWFSNAPGTPHVNLTSVWTLAGAMLLPASLAAAVVVVLYGHLWLRVWWRQSHVQTWRVMFNVANVLVCCYVANWFVRWFSLTIPNLSDGLTDLLEIVATVVVYFVVNSVLAGAAIALLQPDRSLGKLLGGVGDNITELGTLSLGAVTATLLGWKPWLVVLIFPPLYALHRSVLTRTYEIAATTDGKTGLLNATSWQLCAEKELDRSRRQQNECGLLMIDLDHFRRVNNAHGHQVGDRALRAVATMLKETTRGYDLCGRFGGEEFVVLLPQTGAEMAFGVANRIREAIREITIDTEHGVQRLTVSIGVATYPENGCDLERLLFAADVALFAAKDGGRDRVCSS